MVAGSEVTTGGMLQYSDALGIAFKTSSEKIIGECEHAAACVVNEDDLAGVEKVVRDDQRADGIFGDDATSVTDDVSLACS